MFPRFKRILLSIAVVILFALYAIHERSRASSGIAADVSIVRTTPSGIVYRNGVFLGDLKNATWGFVQVQVTIAGGAITEIEFLQFPDHRATSREINEDANPRLIQEAIAAQSAEIDSISGATDTSDAFIRSLRTALEQAH